MFLQFSNQQDLVVAITSRIIPQSIVRSPAKIGRSASDIWFEIPDNDPAAVRDAAEKLQLQMARDCPAKLKNAYAWHEVIRPTSKEFSPLES
ncbi:MAG: hypothetical protein ACI9G1_000257 [Pirellulaceae bacterium]|jgi:hypothetical protein